MFTATAAKVARMLLVLAMCGQVIFMVVADFIYQGVVTVQFAFGLTYVMCSMLQVCIVFLLVFHLPMSSRLLKKMTDPP